MFFTPSINPKMNFGYVLLKSALTVMAPPSSECQIGDTCRNNKSYQHQLTDTLTHMHTHTGPQAAEDWNLSAFKVMSRGISLYAVRTTAASGRE